MVCYASAHICGSCGCVVCVHGVRVGGVCVMYAVYLFLMSVYVVSVFEVSVFEVSVYMLLSGAVLGQCRIATFLTCSYGRIAKHIA